MLERPPNEPLDYNLQLVSNEVQVSNSRIAERQAISKH